MKENPTWMSDECSIGVSWSPACFVPICLPLFWGANIFENNRWRQEKIARNNWFEILKAKMCCP